MINQRITRAQRLVYDAYTYFSEIKGYQPTIRDIAGRLEKAPATIHKHILALEEEGLIERGRKWRKR